MNNSEQIFFYICLVIAVFSLALNSVRPKLRLRLQPPTAKNPSSAKSSESAELWAEAEGPAEGPRTVGIKQTVTKDGVCDYSRHCLALGKQIKEATPTAKVFCNTGRQGSFEVVVNDKLIYSKLQTMALPDFEEVSNVVSNVSRGAEPTLIKGQQPVNCVIS